jgi:hypothetical protein
MYVMYVATASPSSAGWIGPAYHAAYAASCAMRARGRGPSRSEQQLRSCSTAEAPALGLALMPLC